MINDVLHDKTIIVAGGDLRQISLARLFSKHNQVYCLGLEQSPVGNNTPNLAKAQVDDLILQGVHADYIVFPMPMSIDNNTVNAPFSAKPLLIDDVLALAKDSVYIYGGKISDTIKVHLEDREYWYLDYLDREDFAVRNAIPTAEGAIQIAMEELPTTIFGMNCLVVGFGRISKALIPRMVALGADVTVSARKAHDFAWIESMGCKAVHTRDLKAVISGKLLIINTVPATVFTSEELSRTDESALIIDLASKPGGIDFTAANLLGLKTIWALSLPGKVAPVSAGGIIYDTINSVEQERSYANE